MSRFFPNQTIEWKIEEPPAIRRVSMSIVEMAVITGVLLRLYRALALTNGPSGSWVYLGVTFVLGSVFIFGMTTLHLGNFPIRHWLWRASLFAVIEGAAEALTSLGLIALGREPMGSERAHFHEWLGIATDIFFYRLLGILVFALVLAGVVQLVRYLLLRHENRVHTAVAVHEEMAKHPPSN